MAWSWERAPRLTWSGRSAHEGEDVDPGRAAVVRQLPGPQGDAARDALDELEIVGRHHEGGAVLVGLVEQFEEGRLAGGVEADEGLVDEEEIEGPDEPEGQRRLLAQAAAEGDGQVVGPLVDAEVAEEVGGVLLPVVAAVQPGDVLQVLPDG